MPPPSIRVLIADDHRLFAEALVAILAGESSIEVVGRARNGSEALELAKEAGLEETIRPLVEVRLADLPPQPD